MAFVGLETSFDFVHPRAILEVSTNQGVEKQCVDTLVHVYREAMTEVKI